VHSVHVIVADVAFADRLDEDPKRYFRSVTHLSQPWAAAGFYRKTADFYVTSCATCSC
jgi:hypothetical protein